MIHLRRIEHNDLEKYAYWLLPKHKYHKLNGPYFKKDNKAQIAIYIDSLKTKFLNNEAVFGQKKLISNENKEIIGEVSWYWKSEETNWLEVGIIIFDDAFWNKGIGSVALKLWINEVFTSNKELLRIGFSTWSGNIGMIKLAQKLGMKQEARYRKARILNGKAYDAVSFGILKTEWIY